MTGRAISIGVYGPPTLISRHLPALASLPITFAAPTGGPADIALVGSDHQAIAEAVRGRPKVILLQDPAEATSESRLLLRNDDFQVLPVLPLASLMTPFVSIVPRKGVSAVRSNLRATGSSRAAKLSHLVALHVLLGELRDLAIVHEAGASYSGRAVIAASQTPVFWTGQVLADEDRFDLDVVGVAARLEIDAPVAQTTTPPLVQLANKDGIRTFPSTHESGLRLLWRHAAELARGDVKAGPPAGFGLLDDSPIFN